MIMKNDFKEDYRCNHRNGEEWKFLPGGARIIYNHVFRFLWISRNYQNSQNKIVKKLYKFCAHHMTNKYGLEIDFSSTKIGRGIQLVHAYNITVDSQTIIGDYAVLFKGATLGNVRSGKRAGSPKLGRNVVVGINAFVCGGIEIGDDVLIAANSFVDVDVPSHSLVFGNQAIIKHKDNATIDYIK